MGKESSNAVDEVKTFVFIHENGVARAKKVKTGIQDLDYFEIKSGLKMGDEVIVEPSMAIAKTMMDGDKVSVKESKGKK